MSYGVTREATRKLRQFNVSLRERGLATTLYWAAFGFLKPNEFRLFASFGSAGSDFPSHPDVDYEIWDAGQMEAWRAGRANLPPEYFQDRIDGVRFCVVARIGDEVAGLIWIYGCEDPSRLFRLGRGDFELNYGTVLPAHRRNGLFAGILRFGAARLIERGCRIVYGGVHARNIASQRAFMRAGFAPIATMRHIAFFRPRHACLEAEGPDVVVVPRASRLPA